MIKIIDQGSQVDYRVVEKQTEPLSMWLVARWMESTLLEK